MVLKGETVTGPIKRMGKEDGYVMMAAAVFAFVLLIGGMAVFSVATGENRNSNHEDDSWRAYFLAEAAIERGRAQLLNDAAWRTGFSDVDAGAGTYSLTIRDTVLAGVPNPVKMVGTGKVGDVTRSIEILGGVDITAFEHSLIVKGRLSTWWLGLSVNGLVHVGQGEDALNPYLDIGIDDFDVDPPPLGTEPAFFPNSTYYSVRAVNSGSKWYGRIYDGDGIEISTALGDSLDGLIDVQGDQVNYTFSGDAVIARYFDATTGVFSMAPGDTGIVVDFGSAPISDPPGDNGYARVVMSTSNAMTIHTTIVNSRFTGTTPAQRRDKDYWYGGPLYLNKLTVAPFNGIGVITKDLSSWLFTHTSIGDEDLPALVCVTGDVTSFLASMSIRGQVICWDDWISLIACEVQRDNGFKANLPPYLLDIGGGDVQGTLEIADWREI